MRSSKVDRAQGAKRPPSPPSPALRPSHIPAARSAHLRHLYERQQAASHQTPTAAFDAPVPNELYAADDADQRGQNEEGQQVQRGREDGTDGGDE